MLVAVAATPVLAQTVDLTGAYKCIQMWRMGLVGSPAFITQNGPQLNLLARSGSAISDCRHRPHQKGAESGRQW